MYRSRHVPGRSYRARPKTAVGAARATASRIARQARIAAYREAPMLANLAVRGLNLAPGEFKAADVSTTVATNDASSVTLLNGIARGDDIYERTGREVDMRSIQIAGKTYVTAGTGVDQMHRILIVYDRQTNATALTAAAVLQGVLIQTPRNLENRKRFKILYDRTFVLNATGEPGAQAYFEFYRHLRHPETFNSGDAGTVADITTGSIYLITIGDQVAGATAGSTQFFSRIRYQDK